MICIFGLIPKSNSQKLVTFIDSVEKTFERFKLSTALSCNFEFERKVDDFGRAYFINSRDTRVDVSFFNVLSLPFYNEFQTEFGTSISYVNWTKSLLPDISEMEFSIIQESKDSNYLILRISDGVKESLKIISRLKNVLYCISMTSKEISNESQIEYLKLYLKSTKKINNE